MRLSLDKLVSFWSNATPDSLAIVTPNKKTTYRQLHENASYVNTDKLNNSRTYGLIIKDCNNYLALVLALMRDRIIFVNIGTSVEQKELADFLASNSISTVISDFPIDVNGYHVIQFKDLIEDNFIYSNKTQNLSDIVGGFLSSGSTGIPKVFYRNQYSLISEALMWIMELQLTRNTKFFISMPFSYIGSFVLVYSVIYSGGCIIVNDDCSEAGHIYNFTSSIDFAFLTPSYIRKLISNVEEVQFKNVLTMGAPISVEEKLHFATLYNCNVFEMWGNTEGLATITNTMEDPTCTSLGRATFTDEICIVDKHNNVLPLNTIGWIAGITDNASSDVEEESMIVSGDMGFIDEKRHLHLVGREEETIVFSDGKYFSSSLLCRKLREQLDVFDIAVLLIGRNVFCFIETTENYNDCVSRIFNELYGEYSEHVELKAIIYRKIPYNTNGKIDYESLKNSVISGPTS